MRLQRHPNWPIGEAGERAKGKKETDSERLIGWYCAEKFQICFYCGTEQKKTAGSFVPHFIKGEWCVGSGDSRTKQAATTNQNSNDSQKPKASRGCKEALSLFLWRRDLRRWVHIRTFPSPAAMDEFMQVNNIELNDDVKIERNFWNA